jgi:hypothetical protein
MISVEDQLRKDYIQFVGTAATWTRKVLSRLKDFRAAVDQGRPPFRGYSIPQRGLAQQKSAVHRYNSPSLRHNKVTSLPQTHNGLLFALSALSGGCLCVPSHNSMVWFGDRFGTKLQLKRKSENCWFMCESPLPSG